LFQEQSTSELSQLPLPGGITEADGSDSYIQEIASFALDEIDRRSDAPYRQKILRIVEAQKQV